MLRAISEMAVAIIVRSLPEKPTSAAISRPFWRGVTMAPSLSMHTCCVSPVTAVDPLQAEAQHVQPLIEVQCRSDPFQSEAQLYHREGDIRLNPDDHHLGAAQF